jgi:phosphatidylglycerol:prolipoprotein diacylglycerol transferase
MPLHALPFPDIDKVALKLGPIEVRWYGLAWLAGIVFAWLYMRRLAREGRLWRGGAPPYAPELVDDLLLWMTIGVVVGGRLGHVLLYQADLYLTHPAEVLKIWHGGMSFHGGLVGAMVVLWLFARHHAVPLLSLTDACAAAVPVGLGLGRIANFINAEYWGNVTQAPWGMVFPGAGPDPRHPSQLYEAVLEGLVLFLVLRHLTDAKGALKRPGLVTGVFLAGYAAARMLCELFRAPEVGAPFNLGVITTGMVYSLPMLLLGAWLIRRAQGAGEARLSG